MRAAPSTGGTSRPTSTARGATAWMPAATRAWKAVSPVSKMPPPRTTSTASSWRSSRSTAARTKAVISSARTSAAWRAGGHRRRPRRGGRAPARRAGCRGWRRYRCRSAPPPHRPHRAGPVPARGGWWVLLDRRRPGERARGRARPARRRRVRSLPTARPARGSAPSGRRARRRRSSCPFRRRHRCPMEQWYPPARRRTCRCAGSPVRSTPTRRSPVPASARRPEDRCPPGSRRRSNREGTGRRSAARRQ